MNKYQKQSAIGFIGLALLRKKLIGAKTDIDHLFKTLSPILERTNDSKEVNIVNYSTKKGYEAWGSSYDENGNILIELEEPVVSGILKVIKPGKAIDVACGTGRYSLMLKNLGFTVVGTDFSAEMLRIAKKKIKDVNFIRADSTKLPFPDANFDLVVCGLGLNQTKNIESSIKEMARILKPGGTIVLSILHPMMVTLGFHAEFRDMNNNYGYIENTPHWPSKLIRLFNENNLKIINCVEPEIKKNNLNFSNELGISNFVISSALVGLPVACIWRVEKE